MLPFHDVRLHPFPAIYRTDHFRICLLKDGLKHDSSTLLIIQVISRFFSSYAVVNMNHAFVPSFSLKSSCFNGGRKHVLTLLSFSVLDTTENS